MRLRAADRFVDDHIGVAELDAGLDHDADGALEGRPEAERREGGAVDLDRPARRPRGAVTCRWSSASRAPPGTGTSVPIT